MAPGKKKQQLKLAGLSRLLHLSPADSTAAATAACSVREAVEELISPGRTISKSALAAAVPYVGVLLQAAGWLARARYEHEHTDQVWEACHVAITAALSLASRLLALRDKVTLEHLRPALQPCSEDGVTPGGWLVACTHVISWCTGGICGRCRQLCTCLLALCGGVSCAKCTFQRR
jgi:hypothetical protein